LEASAGLLARLSEVGAREGLAEARRRLEAAEHGLRERVSEALEREREELAGFNERTTGALEANGRLALGAAALILGLMALASCTLARIIVGPIARLTGAMAQVAAGAPIAIGAPRSRDEVGELVAAFRKMAEDLARSRARIEHLALHDALTGLPNRMLLAERLSQTLAHAGRHRESLAVLCVDLDHFKAVNDTLGHPVGDALLRAVAHRLRACVRGEDTVSRLGGDEFAVVQVGIGQPEGAGALARRLVEALGTPFEIDGHQLTVGTSVGIALAPSDGATPDELLKKADMALYRAKADGRGRFRYFEPGMDARLQARRLLELDLRKAIAASEFELHYQPGSSRDPGCWRWVTNGS
jgi:diguanylate cyclase (GGDEF)-like protein